jgi:hypothetical protein
MHKESSILTSKPARYDYRINGVFQSEHSSQGGQLGFVWTSTGAETPNFQKRRRKLLPANPYVTEKQEFTENSMTGYVEGANGHVWTYLPDSGLESVYTTPVTPVFLSDLRDRHNLDVDKALQGAVSALATRYFDLGTFLAEFKSVVSLFKGLVNRFLNLLRGMNFDNLANAWLEFRYAWRPLYYDMVNFTKALTDVKNPPYHIFKERKGDSSVLTEESSVRVGSVNVTTRIVSSLSVRGTAETLIEPTRFRVAPLTTAWEVVTFSFIVDWFLSVGNALASFEASLEFPDLQTSGGLYHTYSITTIVDDFSSPGYTGSISGKNILLGYRKERFPLDPSYVPRPQFNFDILKLIDLILITLKLKR